LLSTDNLLETPQTRLTVGSLPAQTTTEHVKAMVDERELAWALAEVARPHFSVGECHAVYAALGAGEAFSAICLVVAVVVREGLPLPRDLVVALPRWLDAYSNNESEPHLRRLIAKLRSQPRDRPALTARRRRPLPLADRYRRDGPAGRQ
jgi:hypothetical protein